MPTAWEHEYEIVPCEAPHAGVVLGTVPVADAVPLAPSTPAATTEPEPGSPSGDPVTVPSASTAAPPKWPGDTALAERAMLACERSEQWQVAVDAQLTVEVRWPNDTEWDAGTRNYLCLARVPVEVASPSPTEPSQ